MGLQSGWQRGAGGSSIAALAGFGALSAGAAVLGASVTHPDERWYRRLEKPAWQPPRAAFPLVWPVLYGLMTASAWRVWRAPVGPQRRRALGWWGAQWLLNAAWSPLFFGKRRLRTALVDVVALLGSIAGYGAAARRVDRKAAWMMAPYLAWTGFAAALNGDIVRRNR